MKQNMTRPPEKEKNVFAGGQENPGAADNYKSF